MKTRIRRPPILAALLATLGACTLGIWGCGGESPPATAYLGATLFDGTGSEPVENAALVVREGRVVSAGPRDEVAVSPGAATVDLSGLHVIPGLVNAHGHVGMARGLETGPEVYTRENVLGQLGRYARYGVTAVVSLGGGGPEGVRIRDAQDTPELDRARLFLAGPVLDPPGPDAVPGLLDSLVAMDVDWVKIRVDDNLDRTEKISPATWGAVIDGGHERGLPVAVHIVELADAKAVVRGGADLVAHSVRDAPVDRELIDLMLERDVCLSPTLTRELSTFVYGERPGFFDDPFFLAEADSSVIRGLLDPERQRQIRESASAAWYREHLPVAQANLAALHDGGVGIAFGTDSGPPARFQGFFEHLEMQMMADAGLDPRSILLSATRDAARCTGLEGVGTLEPGKWADFVVLRE
ncbi:MAG: amidohydrolase family protein, partial [Gemmatimonadetes bacterium]|nr:amidohydrolase family protein [Gemmatimonadota bacterium]NIR79262.1 amidohydrolase family protein [Gemmatimonadota bacterium]NIT87925.1 amidohydrolase family protein [Gemmatimonadota bacterium]NIU31782.1 amidohydrolase family protein [Gemmatimonadota bacterium]NIU36392.1 amidohydrolase family protein [Gemmatimonadota bacterium]